MGVGKSEEASSTTMMRDEEEEREEDDGVDASSRSTPKSTSWREGFAECGDDGAVGGAYASGGGEAETTAH